MSKENSNILVSVICLVYNQDKYIRQCLDGILMQETNFSYEVIVHDDASTDDSANIITEYKERFPDIVKPILQKTNLYSTAGFSHVYRTAEDAGIGKYIAVCGGDDYWTDPLKLQKQVDFLESHSDYGLVRTDMTSFIQDTNEYIEHYFRRKPWDRIEDTFDDYLIYGWFAGPSTWMYRKELMQWHLSDDKKYLLDDIYIILNFALHSKVKMINDDTTVYRILKGSISHSQDKDKALLLWKKNKNVRLWYAKTNNVGLRLKWHLWFHLLFGRLRSIKLNFSKYPDWIKTASSDFVYLFSN